MKLYQSVVPLRDAGRLESGLRSGPRWLIKVLGLAIGLSSSAVAQTNVVSLGDYVVSASRSEQVIGTIPSAVSLVPLEEMRRAQVSGLPQALAEEVGVVVVNTGAKGGSTSVFLRGGSGHQTLFLVDGVRMNDRSSSYLQALAGANLDGIESIEVLRGPQSTLYGSAAMAGVVRLDTARFGSGNRSGVSFELGSFDSMAGSLSYAGTTGSLGYSASLGYEETANDRPGNDFEQLAMSGRLEGKVSDRVTVGSTIRAQYGDYAEPGSRLFASPGQIEANNTLVTAYARADLSEDWHSLLTVGWHQRRYIYTSQWGVTDQHNTRALLDWQNTYKSSEQFELVAGLNYEDSRYTIAGNPADDAVTAGYVSGIWRSSDEVTVTGGLRHDVYDVAGEATTGRVGVAWLVAENTKFRATYGTGFTAPGPDDLGGVPIWGQRGNSGLLPEESEGWDVGFDHTLKSGAVMLSGSYFGQSYTNLFEWETVDFTTYEGRTVNRDKASTRGAEMAVTARLNSQLTLRTGYTYLEAKNDTDKVRLIRRPRHSGSVNLNAQITSDWMVGAGVRFSADRVESFSGMEDYTIARVHTRYAINENLSIKLRVENVLDESYEEVLGYAALPLGVFGGVDWRF